jgi:metallophosphoesterase (TIGR03767 family)
MPDGGSSQGARSWASAGQDLGSDARARYVSRMARARWLRLSLPALLVALAAGSATAAPPPPATTSYATIGGEPSAPYSRLKLLPGWPRVVRDDLAAARRRRLFRRRSLLYFAQLTDFQLADEESPARAEALDVADTPFTSAWRPQEALEPFTVDQVVRQVNRFDTSPIRNRRRRHARLALTITTGDSADNQQVNETKWVVRLLEGGPLNPNSGVEGGVCGALAGPSGEAARYTGVQDDDDVLESGRFWDPDRPSRRFAAFPSYPGLMDRAQVPFEAAGLAKPSYVTFGNHDGTVQGSVHALEALDAIARGCVKPLAVTGLAGLPALFTSPAQAILVPPDPERGFADRPTYKALHATGRQADAHGFGYVDRRELAASRGQAAYYAFSPRPGLRMIAINTVAEGDLLDSNGNLDDPQFRWLARELKAADGRDELVIVFGHHPIGSLTNAAPDENAGDCALRAVFGPGCDLDPRRSEPLHLGGDLRALLLAHPHVIAYVAGHTHENAITAFKRDGAGFWQIETASEIDWPIQSRLLEVMDNRDGTLSIFGTLIDHGAPLATPAPGTPAGAFSPATLAAIAREVSYNDPQAGIEDGAEGRPQDRNVELVLPDPRTPER